jgi:excinuclease ABC subunit B
VQVAYNLEHGITPHSIIKPVADIMEGARVGGAFNARRAERKGRQAGVSGREHLSLRSTAEIARELKRLETEMYRAARNLEFEQAAALRDQIDALRRLELDLSAGAAIDYDVPVPREAGHESR